MIKLWYYIKIQLIISTPTRCHAIRILLTSINPAGSFLSISFYVSLLSLWCSLYSYNICLTVCRPLLLQSHLPISNLGTFLLCKRSVYICVISALTFFWTLPWMQRTNLVGTGARQQKSLLFYEDVHVSIGCDRSGCLCYM